MNDVVQRIKKISKKYGVLIIDQYKALGGKFAEPNFWLWSEAIFFVENDLEHEAVCKGTEYTKINRAKLAIVDELNTLRNEVLDLLGENE